MRALRALLFALLGLVAGYVLFAASGLALVPTRSADSGGREMFIFFGLAPFGALIGAVAGLIFGLRRNKPPAG